MTIATGALYLAREDGGSPATLAVGSAPGESGVSVYNLRLRGGVQRDPTTPSHLVRGAGAR